MFTGNIILRSIKTFIDKYRCNNSIQHINYRYIQYKLYSTPTPSFSETVVRPILKKAIKNVEESWDFTTSHIKLTILETLLGGKPTKPIISTSTSIPTDIKKSIPVSTNTHPILGELLYDLGYKKVYISNIISLVNATVWEKQRTLRHERAELIASNKIESGSLSYIPGIITCYRHVPTGNIGTFLFI